MSTFFGIPTNSLHMHPNMRCFFTKNGICLMMLFCCHVRYSTIFLYNYTCSSDLRRPLARLSFWYFISGQKYYVFHFHLYGWKTYCWWPRNFRLQETFLNLFFTWHLSLGLIFNSFQEISMVRQYYALIQALTPRNLIWKSMFSYKN